MAPTEIKLWLISRELLGYLTSADTFWLTFVLLFRQYVYHFQILAYTLDC
jgi:hypothetical protein